MFFLKKRQAELIVSLAETGNLGKSASLLHMTQPAASKILSQLEEEAGFILFARDNTGTAPTAHGELAITYARGLINSTQRITEELKQLKENEQRSLAVGALGFATLSVAPELIYALTEHMPNLQVRLEEGTAKPLLDKLRHGELDLVVGRITEQTDIRNLNYVVLDYEPMVLACGTKHPLADHTTIDAHDLQGQEWIFPADGTFAQTRLLEFCKQWNLDPPRILLRSSVIMTNIIMLNRKNLVGALPLGVARYFASRKMLHILPINSMVNFGQVVLFTNPASLYSPHAPLIDKISRLMSRREHNGPPA